jgi:hypothetical protein
MTDLKTYIARESAIGSVINIAIGSAFFLVLFRGQTDPQVWGPGGLILDCLPQGFMIGLMSIIPSMLITRKRLRSGQPMPSAPTVRTFLPRGVFLRGLAVALASMAGLVALAAALASITGVQTLPFWPAFALKALPGLIIPWIVTPPAIRVVLSSTPLISPLRT